MYQQGEEAYYPNHSLERLWWVSHHVIWLSKGLKRKRKKRIKIIDSLFMATILPLFLLISSGGGGKWSNTKTKLVMIELRATISFRACPHYCVPCYRTRNKKPLRSKRGVERRHLIPFKELLLPSPVSQLQSCFADSQGLRAARWPCIPRDKVKVHATKLQWGMKRVIH